MLLYIFFDEPRAEDESGYQIIIGKNILQTLRYVCTGICRDGSRVVGNIGVFREPKMRCPYRPVVWAKELIIAMFNSFRAVK